MHLQKIDRLWSQLIRRREGDPLPAEFSGQAANDLIRQKLTTSAPCMIARLGRNELRTILRRYHRLGGGPVLRTCRYVLGRHGPTWWDDERREKMRDVAGFFPCDDASLDRFSDLMLRDLQEIDVLATWCPGENHLATLLQRARRIPLGDLEPFWHDRPWSEALVGRTVLVVHPFARSIARQYEHRQRLFDDSRVLPDFELKTIPAVQSIGGDGGRFATWFEAYQWMCDAIAAEDFDTAIIGAGAYGLPLAAFVKRSGKQAVHMGGVTQILFGIRGRRWDAMPKYEALANEHWIRPLPEETPAAAPKAENACYW